MIVGAALRGRRFRAQDKPLGRPRSAAPTITPVKSRGITMQRRIRFLIIPIFLLLLVPAFAQDPSLLTVDSLFTYRTKFLGPVQWQADGSGYLALEPSPTKEDFVDIVRYAGKPGT